MKTDYLDVLAHCDTCTVPAGVRCESAPGNCPYSAPKSPKTPQIMQLSTDSPQRTADAPD
jgi:hypothetical protein